MTLYCRNGYYYIRYKKRKLSLHTNDKQIAKTIYTRLLFKLVLDELHFSIHSKPLLQQKKKEVKVLVKNVFDDYIKMSKLKGVTKSTINFKNSCFRIIEKCNIVYFSDFNQTNVNKFVEYIQKYSVDTQRKYVTDFYAFLHNSVKKGYIKERVVDSFDLPKTRSKARELIISDKDWEAILTYAKEHDLDFYYYMLTLFNTFCRPSEILKLKGSDFILSDRKIDIFQNKTQKNKRVYLYEDFCKEISELISIKGDNYLFDGVNKNDKFYYLKLKEAKRVLGLNEKYTLYTVRHTSITYLMNKTNDVEFVARQAGDSPEIILKHYINRNDNHYLKLMEK